MKNTWHVFLLEVLRHLTLFLSKQKYSNMYNDNIFFTLVYLVLQHLNKDATFQMHLFRCQSITYCTTSQYIVHFISFKKACCVLILATFRTWKKKLIKNVFWPKFAQKWQSSSNSQTTFMPTSICCCLSNCLHLIFDGYVLLPVYKSVC